MAVMARETWTDERLDDLNAKVDAGFGEMREEFRAVRTELRTEMGELRGELKGEMAEMRGELRGEMAEMRGELRGEMGQIRTELAALNNTIHQFTFAMVGTVFLGFCGTIAALVSLT